MQSESTIKTTEGYTYYETSQSNAAAITAGTFKIFLSEALDKAEISKFGSFNYLEVINDSSLKIYVDLDGLSTRRRILFGKSILIIPARDSIFFNNVKITNTDGVSDIGINEILINAKIVR